MTPQVPAFVLCCFSRPFGIFFAVKLPFAGTWLYFCTVLGRRGITAAVSEREEALRSKWRIMTPATVLSETPTASVVSESLDRLDILSFLPSKMFSQHLLRCRTLQRSKQSF
mmetsp:Transcript_33616/g.60851  ORF Transcript_33616/g.60851 Transcript_33616/m.60851 type:complete len:112 (-) Transcript_33616:15-350(-)